MLDLSSSQRTLLQSLVSASLYAALRQQQPSAASIEEACRRLVTVLDELIPFVPAPIVENYVGRTPPALAVSQYVTGTVVLARLSGFTALAGQLAQEGRQGSETLSTLINQCFPALVDEIHARGGSVIKFGGAGLTVLFDAARVGGDHPALAAAAALAMQEHMRHYAASVRATQTRPLGVQIGVQSGKLLLTEVGDAEHRELIITGRTISRAATALEHAGANEIMITDDVQRALRRANTHPKAAGYFVLRQLDHPAQPVPASLSWQPAPPSLAALQSLVQRIAILSAYIPPRLPRRFLRAGAEIGEFRPVTALAANFDAFGRLLALLELPALMEHDVTIMAQVLNAYYTRTQATLAQYGGMINAVDMAATGHRWLALFGAPTAHKDDPARAVQAALALRTTLIDTRHEIDALLRAWLADRPEHRSILRIIHGPLRQRVGVATGTVYAGIVGTPQRREYAVLGATVPLATQLMAAAAEGEVVVSDVTQRAIRTIVATQPLPPLALREFGQQVAVFRVTPQIEHTPQTVEIGHKTAFIARHDELQQIERCISQALDERIGGQIIAITGDPGIGKTRLADEAVAWITARYPQARVVREVCESYEQTTPYAPIARLVRYLLKRETAKAGTPQMRDIVALLEQTIPDWIRFAPLLSSLIKVPLPETELTQALTPEQRNERLCDLLVMLCCALAERTPLVLVLDDLQWADPSSLTLLMQLAAELKSQPLVLLLIYRPSAELVEHWRDLPACTTLRLHELEPTESHQLAVALLGGAVPQVIHPLIARANGSPFFIEHTIRYIREAGLLYQDAAGAWQSSASVENLAASVAVEQLIVARLDQLPEDSRALIHIAAVIGQTVEQALLTAVDELDNDIEGCLAELVTAAFLEPDAQHAQVAYRFKQPLVRDVIYSNLLFAQRRELHGRVALAIEHLYSDSLEDHPALLAQHYSQAELWDQALSHLVRAAQHAQTRYANSEALALYQQACAIALLCTTTPDAVTMLALYENMGDVQALIGNYEGARAAYEWVISKLTDRAEDGDVVLLASVQRKIGDTYEHQGRSDQALSWLSLAAETLAQATSSVSTVTEQARILSDLGWVFFRQDDVEEAQTYLERALRLLDATEAYDEQAAILNRLGGVAYQLGELSIAEGYVQASLSASERSGNLMSQAHALNNLGNLTGSRGSISDSIAYGLKALDIYERMGSRRERALTAINVGWAFYESEAYEQAATYLRQALQQAADVRDVYHQMLASLNLGRVLIELQQFDDAARVTQQGYFTAVQLQLPVEQLEAHTTLAEIALGRNDLESAMQEHQQGLLLAIRPEGDEYGRFQRLEAKLAYARGDTAAALTILRANKELFTQLQNMPEVRRTCALMAQIEATQASDVVR